METLLIIRHLSKADADKICKWVEKRQENNVMEYAGIQRFNSMKELARDIVRYET